MLKKPGRKRIKSPKKKDPRPVEEIIAANPSLPEKKRKRRNQGLRSEEDILRETLSSQNELIEKLSGVEGFSMLTDGEELVETLLEVPNRKPLSGKNVMPDNALVRCCIDRPYQYKRYMALMREGASVFSAAMACDIGSKNSIQLWIRQGIVDYEASLDTYYSRFYRDILRSTAIRAAEVEGVLSIDDPKAWMRNGPGRMIHQMWRDDPSSKSVKTIEHFNVQQVKDADILLPDAYVEAADMISDQSPPMDENTFADALQALEDAGVLSEENKGGWVQALKLQAGKVRSLDELEIPTDQAQTTTMGGNQLLLTKQAEEAKNASTGDD